MTEESSRLAKKLFDIAVNTRNFEIELFWKRSLFFWGFIAAAFVAFGSLYKEETSLALLIACFGFVCSVAWTLVNRGSKYWQENWEQKVNEQEREWLGKEFFAKQERILKNTWWLKARKFSVSKLAIALSDFTCSIWLLLIIWTAFDFSFIVEEHRNIANAFFILVPVLFSVVMGFCGRTKRSDSSVPTKLDHCVIHVSDWERSNKFYCDVLGAELVRREAGFAYRFGDAQLNVHGPGVKPAEVALKPVAPGNSDLCFEWKGPIEAAIAHLKEHGIAVERGPMQRFGAKGAGTSVYFRDPDGSLMEFMSYN